jgi:hypothetical protein
MLSRNRFNAAGRGSTTLADEIARNKPNKPSNCQNEIDLVSRAGTDGGRGNGVANTIVGVASFCVGVIVACDVAVNVGAGDGVAVTGEAAANGIAITPVSLPHRS